MERSSELEDLNLRLDRKVQQLETLIEFGRVLAGISDPDDVAHRLGLTLAGQWALRSYAVLAFHEGRPPIIKQKGMRHLDPQLVELQAGGARDVTAPFVVAEQHIEPGTLVHLLANAGATAIVPLRSGETTIGLAALGPRANNVPFTDDDLLHAAGLAGQAVVALESAWQSQEALHWRLVTEAGAEWRQLDRMSRLIFVAVARLGYEGPQTEDEFSTSFLNTIARPGLEIRKERIAAIIERLVDQRALARDPEGRLRVEKQTWLALPEARKPLAEIARESTERIGAYEIIERLGAGGMGEVFRAVNVHDGSSAALKLLASAGSENPETRRRLEREGAIVSTLSHPNIVRLIERGEHEGRLYLAMELIEGETISQRMRRDGALASGEAIAIAIEVASALSALHSSGVIHRDVKASNVMRSTQGRIVLLDFGLARGLDSTTVTSNAEVMGTLPYMPPEQLRGETVDSRADIWAFGILLFEMMAGRYPWAARDTVRLAVEILSQPPSIEPISRIAGAPLSSLIRDCLAPVDSRIGNGEELLRRLRGVDRLTLGGSSSERSTSSTGPGEEEVQTDIVTSDLE